LSERVHPGKSAARAQLRARRFRAGALIAIAVVVGLVLWLTLRDTGSSTSKGGPTAVTVDQIRTLASSVGHPIFWAGPKNGYTYELTRTSNGSIYIRYLPPGESVGVKKPHLTVATYPFGGAFAAIQRVVKRRGITRIPLARGGLAEVSTSDPTSVHAAYPGVDYQIEVYDPTPGAATDVVSSGHLSAFGSLEGTTPPKPTAVSLKRLKSLAASLGHPIYWIGPKKGYTYELTRTSQDQVYLRYLPRGAKVGTNTPYLTVATYHFNDALGAILALAKRKNAILIKLGNGGRAVIDASNPKSIHLAYPGTNYEIEVFDPSPARARQVVSSPKLTPIG
jgi:hypothetical protein